MEWGDLLLILLFVVLPLFQMLLERVRGAGDPDAPSPIEEPDDETGTAREGAALEEVPPFEWGESPARTAERISAETVVDEEEALELAELQEGLSAEEVDEAVRVSSPVVSLESLTVDRDREQARFRRIGAPVSARGSRPPRVASLLRGPEDLRRGVLLAEILGPPRGLRGRE